MNCQNPNDPYSISLAQNMSEKYGTPVIPVSCLNMNLEDINYIFSKLLYEFMIDKIEVKFPRWIYGLDRNSSLKIMDNKELQI